MNRIAKFLGRAAGVIAIAAALLPAGAAWAADAQSALSDADQACLECHGSEDNAAKNAQDGRKAQVVDVKAYSHSVHGDVGCDGCHDSIKLPAHPPKVLPVKDPGRRAADVGQACRRCHAKVVRVYATSVHAERWRARTKSAPDCGDCHTPHAMTTASVQDGPRNACLACHKDPAGLHKAWLPNAERHLQAVACAACHSPDALPRVDLRLVTKAAAPTIDLAVTFKQLAEKTDANHDGLDAQEFQALLDALERNATPVAVRGRIDLRNGIQAHWMPVKARALRDCFACHDRAAAPYKNVTVSMLDASDGPVRYDAHREVLTSAITVEALKGFYVLGGTRLAPLDLLLALGLGVGISVPLLHYVARRLLRRPSKNKE